MQNSQSVNIIKDQKTIELLLNTTIAELAQTMSNRGSLLGRAGRLIATEAAPNLPFAILANNDITGGANRSALAVVPAIVSDMGKRAMVTFNNARFLSTRDSVVNHITDLRVKIATILSDEEGVKNLSKQQTALLSLVDTKILELQTALVKLNDASFVVSEKLTNNLNKTLAIVQRNMPDLYKQEFGVESFVHPENTSALATTQAILNSSFVSDKKATSSNAQPISVFELKERTKQSESSKDHSLALTSPTALVSPESNRIKKLNTKDAEAGVYRTSL